LRVTGRATLGAPRSLVWATLMDPAAIQHCLPGCKEFEQVGEQEWKATMTLGLAAIKGTYTGRVRLADQNPETTYKLAVEGNGMGNRIRGEGLITLSDTPEGGTQIEYEGDAQVQGPIATVGQRLLPPAAKLLADQFFSCMGAQIS
jgi:uncharacterized protein